MFEQLVVKGAPTTTGGCVVGGSSTQFDEQGQPFARDGDEATCGNCKGLFPIRGGADTWLDDGKAMVKDWDWVLCPCRRNRVRATPSTTFFYSEGGRAQTETQIGLPRNVSLLPIDEAFDELFHLVDVNTGRPLANIRYRIATATGGSFTGVTDADGHTQRIVTAGREALNIEIHVDD
ncbi:PAAR domain-containing protein [Burkholderia ubonensis]|uniref:PAAR domain-containing protein n=1 Tax=Burkholderia ubonensis TaxID=101571 RepID=UPI0008FE9068|nr:PAAR domain-containing protein [Burkholderia ubonensis]